MIRKRTTFLTTLAVCVVVPVGAHAAIKCTITTVGVAFGLYDVFSSAPPYSAGNVTIRCLGLGAGIDPINVALSAGGSGSFQSRRLLHESGTDRMSYNLYLDAGHTQIWGDGTGGTLKYASISNSRAVTVTIFGRIPPGQDVSAGTYSDTIVAIINF